MVPPAIGQRCQYSSPGHGLSIYVNHPAAILAAAQRMTEVWQRAVQLSGWKLKSFSEPNDKSVNDQN